MSHHLNLHYWYQQEVCSFLQSYSQIYQQQMGVSKNRGAPKSWISIGFSTINHPFWGTPNFWKHPHKLVETMPVSMMFVPNWVTQALSRYVQYHVEQPWSAGGLAFLSSKFRIVFPIKILGWCFSSCCYKTAIQKWFQQIHKKCVAIHKWLQQIHKKCVAIHQWFQQIHKNL